MDAEEAFIAILILSVRTSPIHLFLQSKTAATYLQKKKKEKKGIKNVKIQKFSTYLKLAIKFKISSL